MAAERELAAAAGVGPGAVRCGAVRSALEDLERRGPVLRHVGGGRMRSPGRP